MAGMVSSDNDLILSSNGKQMMVLRGTSAVPASVLALPASAVSDDDLLLGSVALYADEATGRLFARARYSNGSFKTFLVGVTTPESITVGSSGADFTSVMDAWNALSGAVLSSAVTINVNPGTYTETLVLASQPYANLVTIQGDARDGAGQCLAATGSITKSGNNCTISMTAAPPSDFDSTDSVIIAGASNAGNVGRFPVVSVDIANKAVTYVNPAGVAEAVRLGTSVVFCPNRIIDFTGFAQGVLSACATPPTLRGFLIVGSAASPCSGIEASGSLGVEKCTVFNVHDFGFYAYNGGNIVAGAHCSAIRCATGFGVSAGRMSAAMSYSANNTYGYQATVDGSISAPSAVAASNVIGFLGDVGSAVHAASAGAFFSSDSGFNASNNSAIYANGATAKSNGVGYYAAWQGVILGSSTSANNSGNGVDYSPATSGVEGNNGGAVRWS
ncbi:MAG: hypothetical protein ABFD84_07730 [Candidatus Polarisedimenticolia bacterium]|nr:hypothetical protein [bacterium]